MPPLSRYPRRSRISLRHALVFVASFALCPTILRADDQQTDPFLPFGPTKELCAVTAFFGVSFGWGGPLHVGAVLAAEQKRILDDVPPVLVPAEIRSPVGAAVVVLSGSTGGISLVNSPLLVQACDFADCWSLEDFLPPEPIDKALVGVLRDNLPLPKPNDVDPLSVDETALYHYTLRKALSAPSESFDRVARSNLDIEDLDGSPVRYRGLIVRIDGKPQRVREIASPERLKQYGAPKLYEIWALARSGDVLKPVCLISPIPPSGLVLGDKQPEGIEVALTGYFLKKIKIEKGEGIPGYPARSVPLIVGRLTTAPTQQVRAAVAASSLLGGSFEASGAPLTTAFRFRAGEWAGFWTLEDPDRVPPLDRRYLDSVKDRHGLPRGFDQNDEQIDEKLAYTEAIIKTQRTSLERFQKSVNHTVTFVQVHTEPSKYRGQVMKIDGLLQRVLRHEPDLQEKQAGITDVYEVWLVNQKHGNNNPACLVCTQLPEGIKVVDEVKKATPVSFVGYFFKKYAYTAQDKKKSRYEVPLLIGYLTVPKAAPVAKEEDGFGKWIPALFLSLIGGTIVFVFLFTWGFRRADRKVQAQIDSMAAPFVGASETETVPLPSGPESEPPLDIERRI